MFISTLRKIIEAVGGGELEIRGILPGGVVRISQFGELRKFPLDTAHDQW